MGKGKRNERDPPVPGGVIWWDRDGAQKHTPRPPGKPFQAANLLFMFGGLFGFQCVMFFILAGVLDTSSLAFAGAACLIATAILIGGGFTCYHKRKNDVITLLYPTSGAVEYLKG